MVTNRIDVYKLTTENWSRSYGIVDRYLPQQLGVCVSFFQLSDDTWRACVWGNDDIGMDFDSPTESIAFSKFLQVIKLQYVNVADLVELGFVIA